MPGCSTGARQAGKVRRCHGDLHLRNICLLDGEPRLFDCIEFNDQIATIDVLYDLAFLLMDLWHRGFPELANLVMNRYLDEADDEDGFILLPFFMAVRAAVRAHVTATQVEEGSGRSDKLVAEARSYFDLAEKFARGNTSAAHCHRRPQWLRQDDGRRGAGGACRRAARRPHCRKRPHPQGHAWRAARNPPA